MMMTCRWTRPNRETSQSDQCRGRAWETWYSDRPLVRNHRGRRMSVETMTRIRTRRQRRKEPKHMSSSGRPKLSRREYPRVLRRSQRNQKQNQNRGEVDPAGESQGMSEPNPSRRLLRRNHLPKENLHHQSHYPHPRHPPIILGLTIRLRRLTRSMRLNPDPPEVDEEAEPVCPALSTHMKSPRSLKTRFCLLLLLLQPHGVPPLEHRPSLNPLDLELPARPAEPRSTKMITFKRRLNELGGMLGRAVSRRKYRQARHRVRVSSDGLREVDVGTAQPREGAVRELGGAGRAPLPPVRGLVRLRAMPLA